MRAERENDEAYLTANTDKKNTKYSEQGLTKTQDVVYYKQVAFCMGQPFKTPARRSIAGFKQLTKNKTTAGCAECGVLPASRSTARETL